MSSYKLSAGDVSTLNEAADLTVAQAKAALRECKKAFLDDAVRAAERLEACAEESKTFLANLERGSVDLSGGHVEALAVGLRVLYSEVKKERAKALGFFVNSEGFDVRLQEIRDTTRKLRVNVQLEIEDEMEAAMRPATMADAGPPMEHVGGTIERAMQRVRRGRQKDAPADAPIGAGA